MRALVAVIVVAGALLIAAPPLLLVPLHLATTPTATVRLAGNKVTVAVADTALRVRWGLQGRDTLADGEGMLFVYDPPARRTFSRSGVPFALDVVFAGSDGRVLAIAPLDDGHPTAASPGPVRWVVELPGGWCSRNGVEPGARLEVPGR
jgi:uncharacterized membrane protein (UPF0127 family)